MKRLARITWCIFCVILTVYGAGYLTGFFITLPFDMPEGVEAVIRFVFKFFLNEDMPDPDDMADTALLLYFACALAMMGLVVWPVGVYVWRRVISQLVARTQRN